MRLTEFTDLALRLLMYLGTHRGRMATIDGVARQYGMSRNHLAKVVNELAASGLIQTVRGRSGGIWLAREPHAIRLGDVVRQTEPNFHMAQCFHSASGSCPFSPDCRLRESLARATDAYLDELNRVSLAELLPPPPALSGARQTGPTHRHELNTP